MLMCRFDSKRNPVIPIHQGAPLLIIFKPANHILRMVDVVPLLLVQVVALAVVHQVVGFALVGNEVFAAEGVAQPERPPDPPLPYALATRDFARLNVPSS